MILKEIKVHGTITAAPKHITIKGEMWENSGGAHTLEEAKKMCEYDNKHYGGPVHNTKTRKTFKRSFIVIKAVIDNEPYHTHRGKEVFYFIYGSPYKEIKG